MTTFAFLQIGSTKNTEIGKRYGLFNVLIRYFVNICTQQNRKVKMSGRISELVSQGSSSSASRHKTNTPRRRHDHVAGPSSTGSSVSRPPTPAPTTSANVNANTPNVDRNFIPLISMEQAATIKTLEQTKYCVMTISRAPKKDKKTSLSRKFGDNASKLHVFLKNFVSFFFMVCPIVVDLPFYRQLMLKFVKEQWSIMNDLSFESFMNFKDQGVGKMIQGLYKNYHDYQVKIIDAMYEEMLEPTYSCTASYARTSLLGNIEFFHDSRTRLTSRLVSELGMGDWDANAMMFQKPIGRTRTLGPFAHFLRAIHKLPFYDDCKCLA